MRKIKKAAERLQQKEKARKKSEEKEITETD